MTPQNNNPASLYESARELIPAYTAGIADADERALVERALVEYPELSDDLAAYTRLSEGMLLSAPPVAAPAHLRAKILQAAGAPAPAPTVSPARQPEKAKTPAPATGLMAWLDSFFRPSLKLRPALVLAVLVLFIATNVFWWQQLRNRETATIQSTLLNFVGTGEGATTQVNFQAQSDAPQASLVYSKSEMQDTWIGLFSVRNLPALTEGTYQGWLMRDNQPPLSIGVFDVDENGTGWLIFEVGEPIADFQQVGVTAEPDGGSTGPTTNPVVAGEI